MKWEYIKPTMICDSFIPNEYCSTCGDVLTYLFSCDAGCKTEYHDVYKESNGVPGLQTRREWIQTGEYPMQGYVQSADDYCTGSFHQCGEEHSASSYDRFDDGYVVCDNSTPSVISVKIWHNSKGYHCTTETDINNWEILKS